MPNLRKALHVVGNMAKTLTFILLVTLLSSCRTTIDTFQTSDINKVGLKSENFRGTIFKNTYPQDKLFIPARDSLNRFTPTREDIVLAEAILKREIKNENNPRINQVGKKQYIDKNLNKYFRQYVGFIDKEGDRIIHINFHWDRFSHLERLKGYWDSRLEYTSDFAIVFDGGSRYWNVNVNLDTLKLYGLSVNGVA